MLRLVCSSSSVSVATRVCRSMVQLLVLPHTVCDSSPLCGLHPVGASGWEHRSVPLSSDKPVLMQTAMALLSCPSSGTVAQTLHAACLRSEVAF